MGGGVSVPTIEGTLMTKKDMPDDDEGKRLVIRGDRKWSSSAALLRNDSIEEMSPQTREFLVEALAGFFLFKDESRESLLSITAKLQKHRIDTDVSIVRHGELGDCMYIVESGTLQVVVKGRALRLISPGEVFGELAVLYHSPRSATVVSAEPCVIWALEREVLVDAKLALSKHKRVEQCMKLRIVPHLRRLEAETLSKLTEALSDRVYSKGEALYCTGEMTSTLLLIETGSVAIRNIAVYGNDSKEGDALSAQIQFTEQQMLNRLAIYSTVSVDDRSLVYSPERDIVLGPGDVLGFGAFLTKGKLSGGWRWDAEQSRGICPFQAVALDTCVCWTISIETTERCMGNVLESLLVSSLGSPAPSPTKQTSKLTPTPAPIAKKSEFNLRDFKNSILIGKAIDGVVVTTEYGKKKSLKKYVLKILSKKDVVEDKRAEKVVEESGILRSISSPFVCKWYDSIATPDELVFVLEHMECGDLYRLLHHTRKYIPGVSSSRFKGFPYELALFYAACMTIALGHIHSAGVVYRNLCLENVMLDKGGFVRLVGLSLAKRLPYCGSDGALLFRTFTLCGSAEYLAPEVIANTGHDFAADIWALGIIVYEMLCGSTPYALTEEGTEAFALSCRAQTTTGRSTVTTAFAETAQADPVVIFKRIIESKSGPPLSIPADAADFRVPKNKEIAEDLVRGLLRFYPSQRIGVSRNDTIGILRHDFFASVSVSALLSKTCKVPYVPNEVDSWLCESFVKRRLVGLPKFESYAGDQKIFANF